MKCFVYRGIKNNNIFNEKMVNLRLRELNWWMAALALWEKNGSPAGPITFLPSLQ